MNHFRSFRLSLAIAVIALASITLTTACSSSGSGMQRTSVHYGAGYRGYYRQPWGYPPVYIGGGAGEVDPEWGVQAPSPPVAAPMPEMGYPDMGGMDMGGMDFGGFDW